MKSQPASSDWFFAQPTAKQKYNEAPQILQILQSAHSPAPAPTYKYHPCMALGLPKFRPKTALQGKKIPLQIFVPLIIKMPISPVSSRSKSNGSHLATFGRRSLSSSFASSSSSSFSSSSTFFARAASPTRANPYYGHCHDPVRGHTQNRSSPSVRFSIDNRPISPNRSISYTRQISKSNNAASLNAPKRTCACSPTTHPGSFRCALHKRTNCYNNHKTASLSHHSSSRLNYRRSAMTNSVVRIGGVEGELVKRALTALIRPSSHQQRRRAAFEQRPSRLSVMSKADDL